MRKAVAMTLLILFGAQTHAQVSAPLPPALTECEPEGCVILRFHDGRAEAHWGNGAIGNLTVKRYDGHTIRMSREDVTGAAAGLHAEYIGTLQGNDLTGKATFTWPGHGAMSNGAMDWKATRWATAEPVRVSGATAQKLEKQRILDSNAGGCAMMAARMNRPISIRVEFTVLPGGGVTDIKELSQEGHCKLKDITHLDQWTFNPYLLNGVPAAMRVTLLVEAPVKPPGLKFSYP